MSRASFALAAALLIAAGAVRAEDSQTETPAADGTATPASVDPTDPVGEQKWARQLPGVTREQHSPDKVGRTSPPAERSGSPGDDADSSKAAVTSTARPPSDNSELESDDLGTSDAQTKPIRRSNGDIARTAASDARKKMTCADWGVVTATSLMEYDNSGALSKNFNMEYLRTVNGYGYNLNILKGAHGKLAPSMCNSLTAASKDNVVAGSEWYYAFNGQGPAVSVWYFWRAKGHSPTETPEKAEAALAAAANKCAATGLPLDDLTNWPPCVGDIVMQPNDDKFKPAVAFFLMLLDSPAKSVGTELPSSLGVFQKQISVSNGGAQATFTFYVLLN